MRALTTVLLGLLLVTGCEDRSYREIGAQIDVLTKGSGELVPVALTRLGRIGRPAIPQIETALHTASARGKLNLVKALAAVGDGEAAPILQHFATFDANAEVRSECEALLTKWAAGNDDRSTRARASLARVADKRARGEDRE
jgi:hypothetical protein